jgi:hypothetical protein
MMSRWLDSDETTGSTTMIVNGFPDNFLKTVSWTGSLLTITDQENNATEIPINTTNNTNDEPFVAATNTDDTETLETETLESRTLYGFMDVNGDIVRGSVGVTIEREAAGKYRIRFPARNSEFYMVSVAVMNGGQNYTAVVANHYIDNFRIDVRNNNNNYVSRPLSFSITEIAELTA